MRIVLWHVVVHAVSYLLRGMAFFFVFARRSSEPSFVVTSSSCGHGGSKAVLLLYVCVFVRPCILAGDSSIDASIL